MILAVAELADVERRPIESFDNSRCAADLVFAETPAIELLLGSVAEAAAVHILALQAVVTAHEQTGGAEKLLETARDYALTRRAFGRSEEHTSELQSLMRISYAGFFLKKKTKTGDSTTDNT